MRCRSFTMTFEMNDHALKASHSCAYNLGGIVCKTEYLCFQLQVAPPVVASAVSGQMAATVSSITSLSSLTITLVSMLSYVLAMQFSIGNVLNSCFFCVCGASFSFANFIHGVN